jgi:hypothetical protein
MSDLKSTPRFLIRQGTWNFMVWDRETRRPAVMDGRPSTGLTKDQAILIKDLLEKY